MASFFRQFRGLHHSDKLRFCGIVASVLLTKVCLQTAGFKRTVNLLKKLVSEKPPEKRRSIKDYRYLKKLSYDYIARDGFCLPISLIFWGILKREGIETKLYFGMQKENGKLIAHAWLEHEGIPLVKDPKINGYYKNFEISIATRAVNW